MKNPKDGRDPLGRMRPRLAIATALLATLPAGAVIGRAAQNEAPPPVVSSADPCVDLRAEATASSPSIQCLPRGQRISVLESRESWLRVRLRDGQEGWVARELVSPGTVETQAGEKELEATASDPEEELARLREENRRLSASAGASARVKAAVQQQLAARREELATARADNKELEERVAALQSELAEQQDDNQRLADATEASTSAEAEALRRLAETQEALTVAREEAGRAAAVKLELETRIETLESDMATERERIVDDYAARLGAAEIFLSESEANRREIAEQLEASRQENEELRSRFQTAATDETASAESLESHGAPSGQQPETQPLEISQPDPELGNEAESQEPMAAVQAWARAWSEQQTDGYLAFYSRTFESRGGASREEWEAQRRQRIASPSRIEVRVALIDLRWDTAERAEIEFLQSYESDSFSDTVVKTLELVREDGGWRIAAERVD